MFERIIHHNMKFFFTLFCCTYWLDHQCYDTEIFAGTYMLLKVDRLKGFVIWSKIDRFIINNTSRYNLQKMQLKI